MVTVLTIPKKIYDFLISAFFPRASNISWGAVVVGDAATQILASQATRTGLIIVNNSTNTVFLGGSNTVTLANGLPLEAGASYENQDWVGAIWGISTADSNVRYQQFY